MLDLRLVWDDSAPCLLACSGGLRYVLLRASVVHHLPVVSHEELHVLIEAIHLFTETGQLWDARQWSQKLGRKLSLYHWGVPITSLPTEHADFTEDPQVNFTAMRSPLPTSSYLHSSTVTFEDLDEEEPRKERTQELKGKRSTTSHDVSIDETLPAFTTPGDHFQDNSKQSSVLDPLSNNSSSLTSTISEDKRTTNFASVLQEQTLPNPCTTTHHIQDTSSASSALPHPSDTDASTSHGPSQAFTITTAAFPLGDDVLESVKDDVLALLQHSLPKSRTRTNVVTNQYTPRGRLFGGYTTRGLGATHATWRFPEIVKSIMVLARSRPTGFAEEPFLSAQVNAATSLPIHKDKNNDGKSWLIAFGDFTGGRLWLESPIGTEPPPLPTCDWQRKLRGEYINVRNTWVQFDPSLYHCVEEVKSGVRRSVALFSPKGWRKMPPQCLDELGEVGFFPPLATHAAEADATALPFGHSTEVPSSLPVTTMATEPLPTSGSSHEFANCNSLPSTAEAMTLTIPNSEEQEEIEQWCKDELVSLPWSDLPVSNGSILPLSEPELQELAEHVHSGHVKKSNLCRGCLEAEGPRRIHRTIRDIDKATHTLHIDIAGPLVTSDDGFTYFLVGALRLPGFPLLIDVRLLTTRTSTEVCDELEKMVAFFEALQSEGFAIGETSRIKRLHSDRAGEFTAPFFARFLANHRTIHHSFTTGYDPQANGTAERTVGLIKSLAARCLANASLDGSYWSFAVRYAAQSLLCRALQLKQKSLPFGTSVVAQVLGHRDVKFPTPRSLIGRLLFYDHINDQSSYILCPPEDDVSDPLVHKAGLPVRLPPGINIDDLAALQPLPDKVATTESPPLPQPSTDHNSDPLPRRAFDIPMASDPTSTHPPTDLDADPLPDQPLDNPTTSDQTLHPTTDLDVDPLPHDLEDDKDDDVLVELSHHAHGVLPEECPFTFLCLSSEDSSKDPSELDDLTTSDALPEDSRKQGVSHIPVTATQVLSSTGNERRKWIAAAKKELDNLSSTTTIEVVSPEQKEQIKAMARSEGKKYTELPSKGVFSIKPDKYKVRIVACGNMTSEIFGKISTSDLDAAMLRFLLSWGASLPDFAIASLDVTAAFLNAALPKNRVVVLRPPTILYKLQLIPPGHVWLVHKAIYGLREAPNLWSEERTDMLQKTTFTSEGEQYCILLSEIHKSLCLLVKRRALLKRPRTDRFGLTSKVLPEDVIGLSGIYVDDFLTVGPPRLVQDFIDALRRLWKTSDPQYLTPTVELTFLGVTVRMTPEGLLLHQHHYTNDLLAEHSSHITARKRLTSGEPDHFKKDDPLPPDATNPDHQEWVKRGQRILGGLLWLSTRTRPDLAFAVSSTAQVLTRDLELLKVKLRHILQYLNTTKTLGLLYPYPRKRDLTEFTVFGDSSFAPSGKHSQSGFTIHLSFGNVRHLIHWQSQREQKIAESSAESELYALAFARKSARNFRLLIRESFATSVIMSIRCDNTAAISMLDEPGWRTRYISIYGESARQELLNRTMVLTYVSTDRQLADPMTKPTTALVNSLIFPQWGLVSLPDG